MRSLARRKRTPVPPLNAFLFAIGLSAVLIAVLVPVLPGDTPLEAGDVAFKTFEVGGNVIVEEGETVTTVDLNQIERAGLLGNNLSFADAMAAVVLAVLAGTLLAIYLSVFQPPEVNTVRRLIMYGVMLVIWVGAAKVFLSLTLPDEDSLFLAYILPIAAGAMLTSTLLDSHLGIVTAAFLAIMTAFVGFYMPDARNAATTHSLEPLQMASTFFLGSVAGVLTIRRAEHVNRYVFAGMTAALVSFTTLFGFWLLMPGREGVDVLWMLLVSGLGGFGAAVLTVGVTITVGVLFGVTTRIQLMELSSLTHPLLQRMQDEAPGTFHHSVMVGTLAERAAHMVNTDSLLARVGAYFHDIGKMENPHYYIENQMDGPNPHDQIDPEQSADMIFEHVRQGLVLTKRHRIPPRVQAFVPEHHGTRLVVYFYRKACTIDPSTDPERYRYPGPRPQSPETGIVMLADSVEAVVRASKDHSFEKIDELVDQVIGERIGEGQLDDCDLTMRDLRTIAETFKATLRGIYHKRIEYPPPGAAVSETDTADDEAKDAAGEGGGRRRVRVNK